jgi:monothiol glutaredoxin
MIRRTAKALLRRLSPSIDIPRVEPAEPPADTPEDVQEQIAALVSSHRIVLFMKGMPTHPQCGFSAAVSGTLSRMGIAFHAVDVLAEPAMREGVKTFSDWPTLPQLFVDGDFVGGADIVAEMESDGSLATLLGVSMPPPVHQTSPEQIATWLAEDALLLLDVRTDAERAIASVEGARPLRQDDFAELEQLPRDTRIAFLCHHGIRSQAAAEAFRQIGFTELHNVVGGIEAWSVDVDPSIPRY